MRRTQAQRRAAALVGMAGRSVNAHGPTARPLFEVVVGDETARHLCQLASGTVLHPEPLPERELTVLDVMRAKARWAALRDDDLDDAAAGTPQRGPFTPAS